MVSDYSIRKSIRERGKRFEGQEKDTVIHRLDTQYPYP